MSPKMFPPSALKAMVVGYRPEYPELPFAAGIYSTGSGAVVVGGVWVVHPPLVSTVEGSRVKLHP
jgi:hypothetical protein